ncbi:S8 family serine peptidase [Natronoglycomyces albus]|uniref:S8 family serine peptidase n=1 Tax=Natronoglycomyces albus TaxID=2811108 RepID=A0A895XQI0_9ACTN|nr:S8 family serine peptidase [Natronoglycomyces albus]QSB05793.1 S8 family serine peptidase [Natronoglycomyces albus]
MAQLPRMLTASLLCGALIAPAAATANESISASATDIWLVQTSNIEQLRAHANGLDFNERNHFEHLWQGISIEASSATARYLENVDGVEAVFRSQNYDLPDVEPGRTAEADSRERIAEMDFAVDATGVSQLPDHLTGTGMKIGIIDTGIDYLHPDLGGCFGPGCKVSHGYDFVGDDFDATEPGSDPQPGPDPMDCNGHGTHVAGISAANASDSEGVNGVAPDAELGAYRVFGCSGSTSAEVMLAAMERAYTDGMDVVNMSIGLAFSWPEYPTAVAANELVEHGVSVVASIGNSGEFGVYSASAPGLGTDVIGVASIDNPFARADAALVRPLEVEIGYGSVNDAPGLVPGEELPPLRWHGLGCPDSDAENNVEGFTALMVRGECTFAEKYERAIADGAQAVVIYNDRPGLFAGTGVPEGEDVVMATLSKSDGEQLHDLASSGEDVTLEATGEKVLVDLPLANLPSAFTSFGPSPDLAVKPDLAAPGGGIWSTYLTDANSYASLSGTSMAAPHVAGAAALVLQERPELSPYEVKGALVNTANPIPSGQGESTVLEPAHRQGSGMVNVPAAVENEVRLTPEALALGDSTEQPRIEHIEVRNTSDHDARYELVHRPSQATTGSVFTPQTIVATADVTFETDTVDIPAGQTARVQVSVTAPEGVDDGTVYGGYVEFQPLRKGHSLVATYVGYVGDYRDIVVMPNDIWLAMPAQAESLPGNDRISETILGRIVNTDELSPLEDGAVFAADAEELPTAVVHVAHQTPVLEVSVERLDSTESYDLIMASWVSRNATEDANYAFDLRELLGETELSEGDWQVRVRALKPTGEFDNPDHWEDKVSPPFTIQQS